MATEQQNHLKSVVEQSNTLVNEINQLEGQAKSKREMLLKLQGIIEYLQQTGVELPKEDHFLSIPSWISGEITGEVGWSNYELAQSNYAEIVQSIVNT